MKVIVFSMGCRRSKEIQQYLLELNLDFGTNFEIEVVEELDEIMTSNIINLPSLLVNDEVLYFGDVVSKDEIKTFLSNHIPALHSNNKQKS